MSSIKLLTPVPTQADKPLFVFLPGMDGSGTLLRPQINRLTPWFDLRCAALAPDALTEWNPLARQVGHLIAQEINTSTNRRRSIYLCGESFGGCLAMKVLTLFPQLFDRIILINPASSFRRLPWMQLGSLITRRLPSMAYRYSARGLIPFLIEPFRVAKRDRQALEAAMGAVPAITASWRMDLLRQFDAERLPLERMTHPVLLIVGGNDRLLPSRREAKSLLRRFPRAQMTLLPNSGHACLLETEIDLQRILQQNQFLPSSRSSL